MHAANARIAPSEPLDEIVRKVSRRLIPFLAILYAFSYLDRINISFGALSMNKDLHLSATAFGIANSVFYAGYFLCEIPSNLMLAKFGARIWIPRIMITWGIASAATMLAWGPTSLYAIRLLVGIAEAGFVPGILLYLTYWFPPSHRGRATAVFMVAQPITMAVGASISGVILDRVTFLGLAGWRWLFLIEGLPSAILGVIAYFYLTDRPAHAKWLNDVEKSALERSLEQAKPGSIPWSEVLSRKIILLSLAYFGLTMTLNTNATWVPQIVREVAARHSLSYVGLVTALPALCAALAMPIWSAHSDRRMERIWHIVIPMALAAAGWLMVALLGSPIPRLIGLIFCSAGAFTAMSVFWTLPPMHLSPAARPAGIALINSCGILASATSPLLVGALKDFTHSFVVSLIFVAAVLAAAAGLILITKPIN
jgi:ACS family 4-hydroxyphenylacetate permease-like MFS transporter